MQDQHRFFNRCRQNNQHLSGRIFFAYLMCAIGLPLFIGLLMIIGKKLAEINSAGLADEANCDLSSCYSPQDPQYCPQLCDQEAGAELTTKFMLGIGVFEVLLLCFYLSFQEYYYRATRNLSTDENQPANENQAMLPRV